MQQIATLRATILVLETDAEDVLFQQLMLNHEPHTSYLSA
jgi:hypothetical protein